MFFWLLSIILILSNVRCSVTQGVTGRFSSTCSVPLCNQYLDIDRNTCPTSWLCYNFQTSNQSSLCAPQVLCSALDPCIGGTRCQLSSSVCVVNSCCPSPVCMPLSMASLCTVTENTVAARICPSATWQQTSKTFFKDVFNNFWCYNDFALDSDNNLIMSESSHNRVVKVTGKNFTVITLLAMGNRTYTLEAMFIHTSGAIYTVESRYNYSSYQRLFRFQRYANADSVTGVTLFEETSCGTASDQICGCSNLFVDSQGEIYCSDSQNHRVVKIIPYTSTLIIIAGALNGTSGSGLNELRYPSSIYVDKIGNLFVLDSGNNRIVKFVPGSRNGTILVSSFWYSWGSYMVADDFGVVYYTTYNAVYRWVPGTTSPLAIVSGSSLSKLRFDTYGNLYTIDNSKYSIEKYNIWTNSC